jgi:Protein of unknown function (DUF3180)
VRPTRGRTLVAIVVVSAGLTWALLAGIYSSLPPLPWTVAPALLIAAAVEAWTGYDLRSRLRGKRGGKPVQPLYAARLLALAKATSQAGALFGGIFLGFIGYTSGSLTIPTPREDLIVASVTFGACLVLIAAALFLEYCCRVPGDSGFPGPGDRGGSSGPGGSNGAGRLGGQHQSGKGFPMGGSHNDM